MDTKLQILQTATNLFNQSGTAKISTNTIAEEAGISSGNLYYHYKDKAHIIREIYEQMISSWEKAYDRAESRSTSIETLKRFIEDNFELLWEYMNMQESRPDIVRNRKMEIYRNIGDIHEYVVYVFTDNI